MPLSRNIVLLLCAGVVTMTSIGMNSSRLCLRPSRRNSAGRGPSPRCHTCAVCSAGEIGGVFFGKLADDLGARRVILRGILLMAAGFFGMVLSQNLWQLSLSYGFLVGWRRERPDS